MTHQRAHRSSQLFLAFNTALVVLIVYLDAATPAGVIVGILLGIPIVLTSFTDEPRYVWIFFVFAVLGFMTAALWGRYPTIPLAIWVPNRILVLLSLPAIFLLSLALQKRRVEAGHARDEAVAESELNRVLMSLLAHDLREPLERVARDFAGMDESSTVPSLDRARLAEIRGRLARSMSAIDAILTIAEDPDLSGNRSLTGPAIAAELVEEARGFQEEARARGKVIDIAVSGEGNDAYSFNPLLLRRAIAVLLGNAVRNAAPGTIRLAGLVSDREVRIRLEDEGPGPIDRADPEIEGDSGLAMRLCWAMLLRMGGSLESRHGPSGSRIFQLRLPLVPARTRSRERSPTAEA